MSELNRFNTAFRGYDKAEVEQYLSDAEIRHQEDLTKAKEANADAVNALQRELEEAKGQNEKLSKETEEAKAKAEALENQHKDYLVSSAARENEQVRKYKTQIASYTQQIDGLKAANAELTTANTKLKDQTTVLKTQVQNGTTDNRQLAELRVQNETAKKTIEDMKHQMEENNQKMLQMANAYTALKNSTAQQLQEANGASNKQITDLQTALARAQRDLNDARQQNASLKNELTKPSHMSTAVQAVIADKDRMISGLQSQVASLKAEVTKAVKEKSVSSENTNAELRETESSLSDAKKRLEEKDKELTALTEKTKRILEEAEHTADTFGKLRSSIHQRDEQIWDLQKQVAAITGERDTLRRKLYSFYTTEAAKLKKQMGEDAPSDTAEPKK